MRLRQPARAVAAYEAGLNQWPSEFRRDQGVYYGRLARAHAATHALDQAVAAARVALAIGAETKSSRIAGELRQLTGSLSTSQRHPAVASLTEQLRALPASALAPC